jgi:hypothetical protein
MCAGLGLNPTAVATDFIKVHKKPPRQTDAETVRAFIATLDAVGVPEQGSLSV